MKTITVILALAIAGLLAGCGFGRWLNQPVQPVQPIQPVQPPTSLPGPPASQPVPPAVPRTNADVIDETAESTLGWLSAIGIPVAGVAGAMWGKLKPTKRIGQVLESIQEARRNLEPETRKRLDEALSAEQTKELQAWIEQAKKKSKIKPVNKV